MRGCVLIMTSVVMLSAGVVHAQCLPPQLDSDLDEVCDAVDNCVLRANPDQTDTDLDGFGNTCDADFNNDCVVDQTDLDLFLGVFNGGGGDPLFDMCQPYDGNLGVCESGAVLTAFQAGGPPGPNYSGVCPTPAAVPSVGVGGLVLLASLVVGSGCLMAMRVKSRGA